MSKALERSSVTPLPEFEHFGVPPTQTTVEYDTCTEHRPISTLSSKAAIEFQVSTGYDEYLRLNQSYLYMRMRVSIEKPLKAKVQNGDWAGIAPVNNLKDSLFKQIDMTIGDRCITQSHQTYGYKCDFETRLGKSKEAKTSFLTASLWYEDALENLDGINQKRSSFLRPNKDDEDQTWSKEVDIMGNISLDMFEQSRPLIGGCKLKLKFIPNDPAFYLMTAPDVRVVSVEFTEATIYMHRSKVSRAVVEGQLKALQISNAVFPFRRSFVVPSTINKGTMDTIIDNVYLGQLPRRSFVGLVSHNASSGSFALNPYNYQHFNMSFLAFYLNGVQYPEKAFQPDFSRGLYIREYLSIFEATNQLVTDSCITTSREDYVKGNVLIGVNFAPDLSTGCCATGYLSPPRFGSMRIHIRFREPLAQTITLLTYLDFDSVLEINEERNPVFDFS